MFLRSTEKLVMVVVRRELGLFPTFIEVILNVQKFGSRLQKFDESTLLYAAYNKSVELHRNGVKTWYSGFKLLLQNLQQSERVIYNLPLSVIKQACKNLFTDKWNNFISQDTSKLKLYSTFKNNINFEHYLDDVKNFKHRCSLTKLRISAHSLEIEKGR